MNLLILQANQPPSVNMDIAILVTLVVTVIYLLVTGRVKIVAFLALFLLASAGLGWYLTQNQILVIVPPTPPSTTVEMVFSLLAGLVASILICTIIEFASHDGPAQ